VGRARALSSGGGPRQAAPAEGSPKKMKWQRARWERALAHGNWEARGHASQAARTAGHGGAGAALPQRQRARAPPRVRARPG
jgi:hypothetical protein